MRNNTLKMAIGLVESGASDEAIKKLLKIDDMLLLKAKNKAVKKDKYLTFEEFKELCKKVKATYVFFPDYTFGYNQHETAVFVYSNSPEILAYFNRHSEGELVENGYLLQLKPTLK